MKWIKWLLIILLVLLAVLQCGLADFKLDPNLQSDWLRLGGEEGFSQLHLSD